MIGPVKTDSEIDAMREGGKILATIFRDLKKKVKPGTSEIDLNDWVEKEIKAYQAIATYKTPEVNFPAAICISTNDQIVHSVPSDYVLKDGDVVGFDLVITYKGMKTDSAFTMIVGVNQDSGAKRLIEVTEKSLYSGIDSITGATKTGDIGNAIELVLSQGKLGIIRDLVGHGIGHKMHQPPEIPNYGQKNSGVLLGPGDTVAIEPMATLGGEKIVMGSDKWTIKTADGSLAAHFEHTVLVLDNGYEILTQL